MAALNRDEAEAELFGYRTEAGETVPGKVQLSDGGTLFLDEVGDMPLDAQTRLLRFLQNGEFSPRNDAVTTTASVRVIAATSRNLRHRVEQGVFRQDLYYRLNVVILPLPPLRARKDDIPELARRFLKEAADQGVGHCSIDEKALARLSAYEWPGNVRELRNVLSRIIALSPDPVISAELVEQTLAVQLAEDVRQPAQTLEEQFGEILKRTIEPRLRLNGDDPSEVYQDVINSVERPLIELALSVTGGNKVKAAQLLGMNRNTLRSKMLGLEIAQASQV